VRLNENGEANLTDVLAFIQTNLIKIYIEQNNLTAIFKFFENPSNRNNVFVDTTEIQDVLYRTLDK